MLRSLIIAATGLLIGVPAKAHDYPTAALADYVFGCMASNGQNPEVLE